jgi:hypothetical protein
MSLASLLGVQDTPRTARSSDERPDTSARVRIHPFTLRFERGLEQEFESEYHARTLGVVRFALILAIALYTLFGILDVLMAPDQRRVLWTIRYAVVVPLVLAALAFSYHPAFDRWRTPVLWSATLIASLGIVVMTSIIPPPASYLYYAGLLLALQFTFTLIRLNVVHATVLSCITILAYLAVAIVLNPTSGDLIVNNLFFLISTLIIGFTANYAMERYARTNFLQRRVIAARTKELEAKNAELFAKNRMLAESRAENLRTAERSERMFGLLADALPGTLLDDKYRIDEKIGAGTFGTVYRGEHILLHHPVAIKVFRPVVGSAQLESLDRFRVEGISACRINHPNAVTVFDFDVSLGSLAYLVMELLQGRSLADELNDVERLEPRRAARIAAAVCDVLAEAHALGIVHRDIKPSNVFLHRPPGGGGGGDEQVKVIDFGIAKLTGDSDVASASATVTGNLVGSPAYMAPERVSNDPYDGRADVYSVGVMLFEMLSGRLPFDPKDGTHWAVAMMHVSRPAPHLSEVDGSVPREIADIVHRAMMKDPRQRPTATTLADDLRRAAS